MKLLLVTATYAEIRPLTEKLNLIEETRSNLLKYQFRQHNVDILITGVGMVPTAYHLGRELLLNQYDMAINAGICGCFHKNLPVGTVVNITRESFPETGAEDNEHFLTLFDLGLEDPSGFPFEEGWMVNHTRMEIPSVSGLPSVKGVTVNTVHGRPESINQIVKLFDPDTESMEGGAFLYACLLNKLPCLQIRAISNRVEVRNRPSWNLELALRNLNMLVYNILKEI